jgi:cytochrome oxidase Cu insertion factor (SCO1/SenC/PrrC family)
MTGGRAVPARRSASRRVLGGLLLVLIWRAIVGAQAGTVLGPKDGAGLGPTDIERVAVGSLAPDFALESKDGPTVTLSSFRGRKNIVLVFYRGHW